MLCRWQDHPLEDIHRWEPLGPTPLCIPSSLACSTLTLWVTWTPSPTNSSSTNTTVNKKHMGHNQHMGSLVPHPSTPCVWLNFLLLCVLLSVVLISLLKTCKSSYNVDDNYALVWAWKRKWQRNLYVLVDWKLWFAN